MNLSKNLGHQAFSGLAWSATRRFSDLGIKFLVGIALARLLAPEEFGLIAMVTVFIAIGSGVADGGFAPAIIQRQKLTQLDLSSVFYFNVCLAFLVALGVFWGAPKVAEFYNQSELVDILRFLSVSIIVTALGSIHQSQLLRKLEFKRIMLSSLPALVLSGALAVILAYRGWAVWALVAQILAQSTLFTLFLWIGSRWRPTWEFSFGSIRSLFPFGSRLALSGMLSLAFQNVYVLVIGRIFSPADLAYYQRAHEFNRMGAQNLSSIAESVMFPVYSSIQSDRGRIKRIFARSLFLLCFLSFPLMAMMAGLAEPIIITLIGEKWLPSVSYLRWLCLAGALYPIHAANLSILKALGYSKLFLRLELVKKLIAVSLLLLTYRYGIHAIILGQVFQSFLALAINGFYNRNLIDLCYREQLNQCLWPILLAMAVFFVCLGSSMTFEHHRILSLFMGISLSAVVVLGATLLVRKRLRPVLLILSNRFPVLKRLVDADPLPEI